MSNHNRMNHIIIAAIGTAITGILLYNSFTKSCPNDKEYFRLEKTPEWEKKTSTIKGATKTSLFPVLDSYIRGLNPLPLDKKPKTAIKKDTETEIDSYNKTHYGQLENERAAFQGWERILNNDSEKLLNVLRGGKLVVNANSDATSSQHTGAFYRALKRGEVEKNKKEMVDNSLRPTVGRVPIKYSYETSQSNIFNVATRAIDSNVEEEILHNLEKDKDNLPSQFGGTAPVLEKIAIQKNKNDLIFR